MTGLASLHPRDLNLLHRAADGIPEVDLDLIFQIAAGLLLHFHFPAASAAEELAEQVAETCAAGASGRARAAAGIEIKSAEIKIDAGITGIASRRRGTRLIVVAIKSVLVVHLAFLAIRQHVVRFLQLLEFFFRSLVAGIQVRMIFPRELAKSRTNLLGVRFPRDPQKFVKVLFGSRSH